MGFQKMEDKLKSMTRNLELTVLFESELAPLVHKMKN